MLYRASKRLMERHALLLEKCWWKQSY